MSTSAKNLSLRVVFDSNIYVAAALRPGQYADRWLDIAMLPGSGLELFVSPQILGEVRRKLAERFGFEESELKQLTKRVRLSASVVSPDFQLAAVPDDPDDNAILECAVTAKAHLIVTADADLLKLNPYESIGIAHPRELKRIFANDYLK